MNRILNWLCLRYGYEYIGRRDENYCIMLLTLNGKRYALGCKEEDCGEKYFAAIEMLAKSTIRTIELKNDEV